MLVRSVIPLVVAASILSLPLRADAQLRGMLKRAGAEALAKKGGEKLAGKPAEPAPTTAPTAADAPADPPATSAPTATSPAAAPATPASAPAARADAKPAVSPLEISELNLADRAKQVFAELEMTPAGDWSSLPYIPGKAVAAAKALDEPARVAFVEKLGAAFKALVMSDTFGATYAAYIKERYKAVDHGLKGAVSLEQLQKRSDPASLQLAMKRQVPLLAVQMTANMSAEDIQRALASELPQWRKYADDPKRSGRAKYQRWVRQGDALVALGGSDLVKLRRGYAVLKSEDLEGPNTEEALFAAYDAAVAADEQAAWDQHNLKSKLKQYLTAFVALVPTVDFSAATVQKSGRIRFATPAHEAKGAAWKACFRAGKGPSTAALQLAQVWIKEL